MDDEEIAREEAAQKDRDVREAWVAEYRRLIRVDHPDRHISDDEAWDIAEKAWDDRGFLPTGRMPSAEEAYRADRKGWKP